MAQRVGLSPSTVGRIWRRFDLKPHLVDGFKLSTDPQFVATVVDVVGLYHNPPEKAVVLCVDEKSQMQALDRSQPVLPMMPGMPERRTHDYARHGVIDLFAAFNIADGTVITELHPQHRAVEFKKFLIAIDKAVPDDLDVHLICDNLATHKTRAINDWLAKHPRFHMHFTPTGSSWINQVERWFGLLTDQLPRRGVHKSVAALEKDVRDWIRTWNDDPKPFRWTKTADEILDSLAKVWHGFQARHTSDQGAAAVVVGTQPVIDDPTEPPFQTADCGGGCITLFRLRNNIRALTPSGDLNDGDAMDGGIALPVARSRRPHPPPGGTRR